MMFYESFRSGYWHSGREYQLVARLCGPMWLLLGRKCRHYFLGLERGVLVERNYPDPKRVVNILAMDEARQSGAAFERRNGRITIEPLREPALKILKLFKRKAFDKPKRVIVSFGCLDNNMRLKLTPIDRIDGR